LICEPAVSKGTGELGTFFHDSEGNLIGVAQLVRT
jgi:hypothetical protein